MVLGQSDELHLNVSVTNQNDSAYEAQLFVEHPPSIAYIAATKGNIICNRFNKTIVVCALGNPLGRDASVQVSLRFDPSDLEGSLPNLSFNVFANSTSKQIHPRPKSVLNVNVIRNAEVSILGWVVPEQSFYGGEVKGESAMKYFSDVGNLVQHTFQVRNDGPGQVPHLEVYIRWPHQVANDKPQGKWLLYLESAEIEESGGRKCENVDEPVDSFNILKLTERPKTSSDIPDLAPLEFRRYSNANKSITFSEKTEHSKESSSSSSSTELNRIKRDHAMVIKAEQLVDKDGKKKDTVHMVNIIFFLFL